MPRIVSTQTPNNNVTNFENGSAKQDALQPTFTLSQNAVRLCR